MKVCFLELLYSFDFIGCKFKWEIDKNRNIFMQHTYVSQLHCISIENGLKGSNKPIITILCIRYCYLGFLMIYVEINKYE